MGERRDVVVVGVDGSAASEAALRWAFDEAARDHAELEVVCAWQYPERSAPFLVGGTAVYDAAVSDAYALLGAMVLQLHAERPGSDVIVHEVAVAGPPALALLRRAEGARMLVVGTRGRGSLRSLLLGSVSQQCRAQAPCPVVVVRPGPDGVTTSRRAKAELRT
jgi:nucleotide-binding universal stress UspA family protein